MGFSRCIIKGMLAHLKSKINNRKNGRSIAFWFLRHGMSEGNVLGDTCPIMHDTPLNGEGRREVARVIEYLQKNNVRITDVYSSPQARSQETAEIVAKVFGLPVETKKGLAERHWGAWKDLRWMDASLRLEEMSLEERYTFVPPGGESWKHMEERILASLEEVAEENSTGENVLIVMHRGGLRAILPLFAKVGREGHKEFSVATGALSKFSFDKEAFDFVGLTPGI